MQLSSIVAIYFLFFAFSAFILLPFGVRTDEEAGTTSVPGQADSAPHRFDIKRHLLKAAILGASGYVGGELLRILAAHGGIEALR